MFIGTYITGQKKAEGNYRKFIFDAIQDGQKKVTKRSVR